MVNCRFHNFMASRLFGCDVTQEEYFAEIRLPSWRARAFGGAIGQNLPMILCV